MFVVLYLYILMVFCSAQGTENFKQNTGSRVSSFCSIVFCPYQNTTRFTAAAVVVNDQLFNQIHPQVFKKFSQELETMEGAAKVFAKFLGYGWHGELTLEETQQALDYRYPLYFKYKDSFVTLTGYNALWFYVNHTDKAIQFRDLDQDIFPVATGSQLGKVHLPGGTHF